MGFKWFKARMRMNRMPAKSSAVAGSYRPVSSSFDGVSTIRRASANGDINRAPQTAMARPVTMPVLNNPMVRAGDDSDIIRFVESASSDIALGDSDDEDNDDRTKGEIYEGISNPVLLKETFRKSSGNEVPQRKVKNHKPDFKKSKGKAPMPQASKSMEFITIEKERKTSKDSDIDV